MLSKGCELFGGSNKTGTFALSGVVAVPSNNVSMLKISELVHTGTQTSQFAMDDFQTVNIWLWNLAFDQQNLVATDCQSNSEKLVELLLENTKKREQFSSLEEDGRKNKFLLGPTCYQLNKEMAFD